MGINIKPGADIVTVISEPGALVFATRKEWRELPETALDELTRYDIKKVFKGTNGIFLLLRNIYPLLSWEEIEKDYRLIKIVMDEDGKQILYCMDLSTAEGHQMLREQLALWD